MTAVSMTDKLAIMAQTDVDVTVDGNTFTFPAQVPFTSNTTVDIPTGTILAVMRQTASPGGKHLQVFSVDEVITVA